MASREWWRLERSGFSLNEGTRPWERSEGAVRRAALHAGAFLLMASGVALYDRAHGRSTDVFFLSAWLVAWAFADGQYSLAGRAPAGPDTTDPIVLRERLRQRRDAGLILFAGAFTISFLDNEAGLFLTSVVALLSLGFLFRTGQTGRRIDDGEVGNEAV